MVDNMGIGAALASDKTGDQSVGHARYTPQAANDGLIEPCHAVLRISETVNANRRGESALRDISRVPHSWDEGVRPAAERCECARPHMAKMLRESCANDGVVETISRGKGDRRVGVSKLPREVPALNADIDAGDSKTFVADALREAARQATFMNLNRGAETECVSCCVDAEQRSSQLHTCMLRMVVLVGCTLRHAPAM